MSPVTPLGQYYERNLWYLRVMVARAKSPEQRQYWEREMKLEESKLRDAEKRAA